MLKETAVLSVNSIILQCFGLLLNVFLTRKLGAASVGALSLMTSFYGLALVLSGGSGFIAASRFLSEEIGGGGDPKRMFRRVLTFCLILSGTCALLLMIFAAPVSAHLSKVSVPAGTLRLLSITLPISAVTACFKGRCYAYHRVYIPAAAECIEFVLRAGVMAFCTVFCIPTGKMQILTAFAYSVLIGQGTALVFLILVRLPHPEQTAPCRLRSTGFLRLILPIMGNACIVSLLSTANDALVPLTLLQYGHSTEEALAQFGEFEAIIIPTLFFPSVVQCCMSALMVPALSKARAAGDEREVKRTTERVLEQTVSFSLYVVLILLIWGGKIGVWLGGEPFTGQILRVMAPVVPLIYLEIILEGILRGLGRQNYSTLNYLAEYTVRISVLLICVPLFGFYGIVLSYLACNLTGNTVRILLVLHFSGLRPDWKRILLYPVIALFFSWQVSILLMHLTAFLHMPERLYAVVHVLLCGVMYLGILRILDTGRTEKTLVNQRC
jgi:stage V sporulation protein B